LLSAPTLVAGDRFSRGLARNNYLEIPWVIKTVAVGNTTVYIFSGSKVIAEYDNGALPANPSREYIYSGGALLAKIDSSGTKYYHPDHLSNRVVTDSSGNPPRRVAELGHFPYGESWYNTSGDNLTFTTYERDYETGTVSNSANNYAQARTHVNRLARFSSLDPLAGSTSDPQSLNRYSYVRNLPVMLVDPTGRNGKCPPVASNFDRKDTGTYSGSGHAPGDPAEAEEGDPDPQGNNNGQGDCAGWSMAGIGGGVSIDGVDVSGLTGLIGIGSYLGGGNGGPLLTPTITIDPSSCSLDAGGCWGYPGFNMYWSPSGPGGGATGGGGGGPDCEKLRSRYGNVFRFVSSNLADTQLVAAIYNTTAADLLGQAGVETGWGSEILATKYNNYFGLTAGPAFTGTTGTVTLNNAQEGPTTFGVYPNSGISDSLWSLVNSYVGVRIFGQRDPEAYAQALNAGSKFNSVNSSYNGDIAKASKLVSAVLNCL
jgi:RHS repeat-associated protein